MHEADDEALVTGATQRPREAIGSHGNMNTGRGGNVLGRDRDHVSREKARRREPRPRIAINRRRAAEQQRRALMPIGRQD